MSPERYAEARARVLDWVAREPERVAALGLGLKPANASLAFIHARAGEPPRPTVILHHGYSAGTLQWNTPPGDRAAPTDAYAERLYARGFNVIVPRAPGHGLVRPDGRDDIAHLPRSNPWPGRWHTFVDETVGMARGLGGPILCAGLSGGANLSLLSAARHPEVAGVAALAPMLRAGRGRWLFHVGERLPFADRLLDLIPVELSGAKAEALERGRPFGFYRTVAGSGLSLHKLGTELLAHPEALAGKRLLFARAAGDACVSHEAIDRLAARAHAHGAVTDNRRLPGDTHPILSSLENEDDAALAAVAEALDGFFAAWEPR